ATGCVAGVGHRSTRIPLATAGVRIARLSLRLTIRGRLHQTTLSVRGTQQRRCPDTGTPLGHTTVGDASTWIRDLVRYVHVDDVVVAVARVAPQEQQRAQEKHRNNE